MGWDEAEQQLALTDGSSGLQDFARINFPLTECILDFWHVTDHLTELGLAIYGEQESKRIEQVDSWCHQLKAKGGLAVLRIIEALDLGTHDAADKAAHGDCLCHFRNHQHRMDHPCYLANG